jgi:DNA-binding XRE family transcriptional regulator
MTAENKGELIALGRTIREIRDERSIKADDLAAEVGIERVQLDVIEAGRFDPHTTYCWHWRGGSVSNQGRS